MSGIREMCGVDAVTRKVSLRSFSCRMLRRGGDLAVNLTLGDSSVAVMPS
jgi:hypothetical protein